jgi:hypothetical protein
VGGVPKDRDAIVRAAELPPTLSEEGEPKSALEWLNKGFEERNSAVKTASKPDGAWDAVPAKRSVERAPLTRPEGLWFTNASSKLVGTPSGFDAWRSLPVDAWIGARAHVGVERSVMSDLAGTGLSKTAFAHQLPQTSQWWFEHVEKASHHDDVAPEESRTTVMMRNLPYWLLQDKLQHLLNSHGFWCQFDFMYMPIDFFNWSHLQGYITNVEHYRNGSMMNASVPDSWKPAVFQDGERTLFPHPTKRLQPLSSKRRPARKKSLAVA